MTASNTAFTVFSGIAIILSVIPLWWHLPSWNKHVPTCMFMIWTALTSLIYFVNSIVWDGNVVNWAPVWCDIAIRIQLGASIAIPACALGITRRIYNATTVVASAEPHREMIIDLLITIGIPILEMVMGYVVAGHRFNITEDYGCHMAIYNTPLTYVLVDSWPLIIGVVSAGYGALALRAFLSRQRENRGLDIDLVCNSWRLIALASVDFFITIPLALHTIILNARSGVVNPWVSWDDTHWGYSRVLQFPRIAMNSTYVWSLEVSRWCIVLSAFVFFGFFGFTGEARKNYRLLASTLVKPLGYTGFVERATAPGQRVDLSLHFASRTNNTQHVETKRDSNSFSNKFSLSVAMNEEGLKAQLYSSTKPSTLSDLSSPPVENTPRVPEPAFKPPFVRRVSISDVFKPRSRDAFDQV